MHIVVFLFGSNFPKELRPSFNDVLRTVVKQFAHLLRPPHVTIQVPAPDPFEAFLIQISPEGIKMLFSRLEVYTARLRPETKTILSTLEQPSGGYLPVDL